MTVPAPIAEGTTRKVLNDMAAAIAGLSEAVARIEGKLDKFVMVVTADWQRRDGEAA